MQNHFKQEARLNVSRYLKYFFLRKNNFKSNSKVENYQKNISKLIALYGYEWRRLRRTT